MSDHIFFPLDTSYYVQQYKEALNLEFEIENNEQTYPINLIDNEFFKINEIISEIFTKDTQSETTKNYSLIFQAPDELIDFSKLDFSQLTSLSEITTQLKQEIELRTNFGLENLLNVNFLTKFQIILPLFIRCPIEEISKKEFIGPASLIMHEFPEHPFSTILRIIVYSRMILISKNPTEIKFNLENALTKINPLIQKLCEDGNKRKEEEEILINIFPFLLPKVTEIIYAATIFSFDASLDTEPTKYNLYNLLGQFFILIGSNYPPSFDKTGWQTMSKYFSRIGTTEIIENKTYPDYSFILKNPHLVEPNVVARCVTDLLNSFNLLSYLGLNFPNDKKIQVYAVLIKLAHWNQSFARSAARSLINLSRFPFFKNAINEFKQDLESSESNYIAATLYELMIAYNFTEDFVRFEFKNKLSTVVLEKTIIGTSQSKKKHLNGFQKLFKMNTNDISSIFEAAQLVNGIAIQYCTDDNRNLADLALIMHENQFLNCLEKFLSEYIENKTFLDMKFAQPFIVLASRYVQIRSKMVSLTETKYLGMNIELILNLYSSILMAGPAINNKKQQFTTLSADLYSSRSIISQSIQQNCPQFVFLASEYMKSKKMSLLDPFLFFLSDYFSFNSIDSNLIKDLNDNLIEFFDITLLTESTIMSKAIINILVQLCEKVPIELLNDLIASIIIQLSTQMKNYLSSKEAPRNATKILYILGQVSGSPRGKISIISNSKIHGLCGELHTILCDKEIASKNKYLTIVSLQLTTNLICPSITLNKNLDLILRCGSELLPSTLLDNIIPSICSLLKIDPSGPDISDDVLINAIRALRYGCENPFVIKILKDIPNLNFNINNFEEDTKVFKNPEFYIPFLEFINAIAKVHSSLAFRIIGLSDNEKILNKSYLKKEKIAGDIYNLKRNGHNIKKYPEFMLNAIQKDYNKNKETYNNKKLKNYSNPLPPNSTTAYMLDLPKNYYEDYIESAYTKRKQKSK